MSIRQGSTIIAGSTPVKSVPIIGEIKKVCGTANYVPEGCLQCNGTEFRGDQFSDLWTNYLTSTPAKLNVCTYAEYSNQLNTYGFCNSFAVDTVNQTFKVPTRNSYRKLVKKYVNGNDWYNLYDDGWVEQGGKAIGTEATVMLNYQITFKIPFSNTAYSVSGDIEQDVAYVSSTSTVNYDGVNTRSMSINRKTTTGFYIDRIYYSASETGGAGHKTWKACGYSSVPDTTANIDREFVCVANGFVNASTFDWSTWQNGLNAKLDKNLGNSTNITNCITNIPQDINLELSDGTLTLKAGSKVYVPNGSGVFDTVTISSDVSVSSFGGTSRQLIVVWSSFNSFAYYDLSLEVFSGSSAPSGHQYMLWYDTTNNVVKITSDSGTTWDDGSSLPICILTQDSTGAITSIDQIFNGFGYIGSMVFALPGIKGLAPNGRNNDGTLKNTEIIVSKVLMYDATDRTSDELFLDANGIYGWSIQSTYYDTYPTPGTSKWWYVYDSIKNGWYKSNNGSDYYLDVSINVGNYMKVYQGEMTLFTTKPIFHTLGYHDGNILSKYSMPSSEKIQLTTGTSGTLYTAPANGWFCVEARIASSGFGVILANNTTYIRTRNHCTGTNQLVSAFLPVNKGDIVDYQFGTEATTNPRNNIYFIYAQGEVQ